MQYQSTRDKNLKASSAQAILNGLAPDGGLYTMPSFDEVKFDYTTVLNMDTMSMSTKILSKLLPDFSEAEMAKLVHDGYTGKFETDHLTPTVPVGEDFILELFRGPTSAFKDVALSMLPRLMTASKEKLGVDDEIMILTATSGDTGKAAMEGFCDVAGHEDHRLLPPRRRERRAAGADGDAGGRKRLRVRGTRQLRRCADRREENLLRPSARISCSRVRAFACPRPTPSTSAASPRRSSITYRAYADLVQAGRIQPGDKVDYVVPTGNFGDILAGYYAKADGPSRRQARVRVQRQQCPDRLPAHRPL